MGWLYSYECVTDPNRHLAEMCTRNEEVDEVRARLGKGAFNPSVRYEVVRSACVGTVWYAAARQIRLNGDVFGPYALIYLYHNDRRHGEFGYKDMDETMGPYQCNCPKTILSMLAPVEALDGERLHGWSVSWRLNSWLRVSERRAGNLVQGYISKRKAINRLFSQRQGDICSSAANKHGSLTDAYFAAVKVRTESLVEEFRRKYGECFTEKWGYRDDAEFQRLLDAEDAERKRIKSVDIVDWDYKEENARHNLELLKAEMERNGFDYGNPVGFETKVDPPMPELLAEAMELEAKAKAKEKEKAKA